MKNIDAGYCTTIEELKLKNDQMQDEHIQEITHIDAQIVQMKQDHEELMQKQEVILYGFPVMLG